MRRLLLALLLISNSAFAADNYTATQGSGTTFRAQDVGSGILSPYLILGNTSGTSILGTAGTSNSSVLSIQGIASGTNLPTSHISGSVASGAFVSGSIASGAIVDLGAQADSVCGTATGTCSLISLVKYLNTSVNAAIPAGTNVIGYVGGDGTAGTASTHVLSIQGIASMTPILTTTTLNAETTKVIGTVRSVGNVGGVFDAVIGAAPPANGIQTVALTSGATGGLIQPLIQCNSSVVYDASTNGSTELVALTSGRTIYVCGYSIMAGGTVNVKLIYGTGTACATGSANMTPTYQLLAQVGIVDGSPFNRGLKTASANALCINTSAGVSTQAIVYYAVL